MIVDAPGIYPDIPNERYHADDLLSPDMGQSLSHSGALTILDRSPAHYRWARDHYDPTEPGTPAMEFGSAAHSFVLGAGPPVVPAETDNWLTAAARQFRDAARQAGQIPLGAKQYAELQALNAAVKCHDIAGDIFAKGEPEQSLYWVDYETGVTCRARIDWVTPVALVDLKTTANASHDAFATAAARLGYYEQAEWYMRGWQAVTGKALPFAIVAVENTAPYAVAVYRMDDTAALLRARERNTRALRIFAQCVSDDTWPAYEQMDLETLILPSWIYRKAS